MNVCKICILGGSEVGRTLQWNRVPERIEPSERAKEKERERDRDLPTPRQILVLVKLCVKAR